jgi:hypothetical protein
MSLIMQRDIIYFNPAPRPLNPVCSVIAANTNLFPADIWGVISSFMSNPAMDMWLIIKQKCDKTCAAEIIDAVNTIYNNIPTPSYSNIKLVLQAQLLVNHADRIDFCVSLLEYSYERYGSRIAREFNALIGSQIRYIEAKWPGIHDESESGEEDDDITTDRVILGELLELWAAIDRVLDEWGRELIDLVTLPADCYCKDTGYLKYYQMIETERLHIAELGLPCSGFDPVRGYQCRTAASADKYMKAKIQAHRDRIQVHIRALVQSKFFWLHTISAHEWDIFHKHCDEEDLQFYDVADWW